MRFSLRFSLLSPAIFLAAPIALFAQALTPGSAHYVINYQGQPAGSASYTIEAGPGGYAVSAHGNAAMGSIHLAFSKNESLDTKMNILSESLNGTVNGQAVFVTVKAEGASLQVETSANGQQLSSSLDLHPHTVFLPNFDPSAILLFVHQAAYSKDLWALVPQQSGLLLPATVTTHSDEKGTLNGAPIVVRHCSLVVANVKGEVYSTQNGQLLQQEVATQGFSMVRDGFVLTPPKAAAQQPTAAPDPQPVTE